MSAAKKSRNRGRQRAARSAAAHGGSYAAHYAALASRAESLDAQGGDVQARHEDPRDVARLIVGDPGPDHEASGRFEEGRPWLDSDQLAECDMHVDSERVLIGRMLVDAMDHETPIPSTHAQCRHIYRELKRLYPDVSAPWRRTLRCDADTADVALAFALFYSYDQPALPASVDHRHITTWSMRELFGEDYRAPLERAVACGALRLAPIRGRSDSAMLPGDRFAELPHLIDAAVLSVVLRALIAHSGLNDSRLPTLRVAQSHEEREILVGPTPWRPAALPGGTRALARALADPLRGTRCAEFDYARICDVAAIPALQAMDVIEHREGGLREHFTSNELAAECGRRVRWIRPLLAHLVERGMLHRDQPGVYRRSTALIRKRARSCHTWPAMDPSLLDSSVLVDLVVDAVEGQAARCRLAEYERSAAHSHLRRVLGQREIVASLAAVPARERRWIDLGADLAAWIDVAETLAGRPRTLSVRVDRDIPF